MTNLGILVVILIGILPILLLVIGALYELKECEE